MGVMSGVQTILGSVFGVADAVVGAAVPPLARKPATPPPRGTGAPAAGSNKVTLKVDPKSIKKPPKAKFSYRGVVKVASNAANRAMKLGQAAVSRSKAYAPAKPVPPPVAPKSTVKGYGETGRYAGPTGPYGGDIDIIGAAGLVARLRKLVSGAKAGSVTLPPSQLKSLEQTVASIMAAVEADDDDAIRESVAAAQAHVAQLREMAARGVCVQGDDDYDGCDVLGAAVASKGPSNVRAKAAADKYLAANKAHAKAAEKAKKAGEKALETAKAAAAVIAKQAAVIAKKTGKATRVTGDADVDEVLGFVDVIGEFDEIVGDYFEIVGQEDGSDTSLEDVFDMETVPPGGGSLSKEDAKVVWHKVPGDGVVYEGDRGWPGDGMMSWNWWYAGKQNGFVWRWGEAYFHPWEDDANYKQSWLQVTDKAATLRSRSWDTTNDTNPASTSIARQSTSKDWGPIIGNPSKDVTKGLQFAIDDGKWFWQAANAPSWATAEIRAAAELLRKQTEKVNADAAAAKQAEIDAEKAAADEQAAKEEAEYQRQLAAEQRETSLETERQTREDAKASSERARQDEADAREQAKRDAEEARAQAQFEREQYAAEAQSDRDYQAYLLEQARLDAERGPAYGSQEPGGYEPQAEGGYEGGYGDSSSVSDQTEAYNDMFDQMEEAGE